MMRGTGERAYAELTLRVLLGGGAAPPLGYVDWGLWERIAQGNRVIVRLAERLSHAHAGPPQAFTDAAAREAARARAVYSAMRRVDAACARWKIPYIFLKATRRYPDAGRDVDMLVPRDATRIDAMLVSDLQATPLRKGFRERVAGSAGFLVDGAVLLDVHHGWLGLCGEQRALAEFLLERGRPVDVGGATLWGLSPTDEVLLQGAQLGRGRGWFRITDALYTIDAVRGQRLDWDELMRSAERVGALAGLSCYLTYVARIHEHLFGQALLPDAVARRLSSTGWGTVEFSNGAFHFPRIAVSARVYLGQLGADITARRWRSAARVCLLPLVVVAAALRVRGHLSLIVRGKG